MIGDRELLAFRQEYYGLLVSVFWKEPGASLLLHLPDGIAERIDAARNLHALLGEGWEEVNRFLSETQTEQIAERVADEYTRLFIGPHAPKVNPYESFYLTGRLLDRPLANLRTFLKAIGIEKKDEYSEPEDFLAFEFEVMRWLTARQASGANSDEEKRWLQHQADFLGRHLLIWAPACAQDIEKAEGACFYRGAAKILRGFLELERSSFAGWGLDTVASLEEARRVYGAMPTWRGPTFDFNPDQTTKDPLPPLRK